MNVERLDRDAIFHIPSCTILMIFAADRLKNKLKYLSPGLAFCFCSRKSDATRTDFKASHGPMWGLSVSLSLVRGRLLERLVFTVLVVLSEMRLPFSFSLVAIWVLVLG